jgi:hypothetical protein
VQSHAFFGTAIRCRRRPTSVQQATTTNDATPPAPIIFDDRYLTSVVRARRLRRGRRALDRLRHGLPAAARLAAGTRLTSHPERMRGVVAGFAGGDADLPRLRRRLRPVLHLLLRDQRPGCGSRR